MPVLVTVVKPKQGAQQPKSASGLSLARVRDSWYNEGMSEVQAPDTMAVDLEKLRLDYLFEKGISFRDRAIQLTGIVGESFDFSFVDSAIAELERISSRRAITLKLNSPGGSVVEALAIVARIKAAKCPVTVEGYGVIQSAATMILASGSKRRISKYATVMHHQASYYAEGKHDDIAHLVSQCEREERMWCDWLEELTKKNSNFWYKKAKKDFYLTAQECVELGIADEVF